VGLDAVLRQQADGRVHGISRRGSGAEGEVLSRLALALLAWLAFAAALAATTFPALTGRVVDDAQVLSVATKASLEAKLADLEQKSSIQIVVATVNDLGGEEIEPYANALFREWKLGQKDKNNGVLFLIAPKLHRMRIEVGYGLEGTLTDATSKLIIANAAAPRFKAGDYDGGVTRAVEDIVTTLTTDAAEWKPSLKPQPQASDDDFWVPLVVFMVILALVWFLSRRARRTGGAWIVPMNTGGWSSGGGGGWSSGGSSDSGFSGGGGSSGGGGASGDW
jgi:uncharacterized protein